MSTVKVTNLQHASSASPNIVLDSSGNATMAGTMAMATPFAMKNKIINGAMVIDQRNAGASVTPTSGSYTLDRWSTFSTQASKYTIQQNAGAVTPPPGFSNYLGITVGASANVTVGSSDYFIIRQPIEGYNTADLAFGTASALSITVSFWVRSSLTGQFGGVIANATGTQSYPFAYTINSANTWELKKFTVPGATAGTWNTDNSLGVRIDLSIGVGSTFSGTAGSWSSSNFLSSTGSTNLISTNGATFYITGVQLEVGTVATPFERRLYPQELAMCQRYYETGYAIFNGYVNGASTYYVSTNYKVTKRTGATLSLSGIGASGFPSTSATIAISDIQQFRADPISNASSTAGFYAFSWAANAEI